MTFPLESDWYYTTKHFDNELPLGTRIKCVEANGQKLIWHERTGEVIGYRYDRNGLYPTGWHYIRFDDDEKNYDRPYHMPYVHRDYLEVVK